MCDSNCVCVCLLGLQIEMDCLPITTIEIEAMRLLLEVQMVQCWVEGDGLMLGQRVGLMLGRRGWFDAEYKGMVQCWVAGDVSMLG